MKIFFLPSEPYLVKHSHVQPKNLKKLKYPSKKLPRLQITIFGAEIIFGYGQYISKDKKNILPPKMKYLGAHSFFDTAILSLFRIAKIVWKQSHLLSFKCWWGPKLANLEPEYFFLVLVMYYPHPKQNWASKKLRRGFGSFFDG